MFDLRPRRNGSKMIDGMKRWWQNWKATSSHQSELVCCGEYEVQRMAHDLRMSVLDLHRLAKHDPAAADLLLSRMTALNLDKKEVAAGEPGTFQDLQRLCTLCESHRQCARDLGRDPADKAWEDYCPNVATLKMLNALPWATRSEW